MDSPIAPAQQQSHTTHMTIASTIRHSVLVLMAAALVAVTFAGQLITSFVVKALHDSKGVRVLPATACSANEDGAHFTGCSSLL